MSDCYFLKKQEKKNIFSGNIEFVAAAMRVLGHFLFEFTFLAASRFAYKAKSDKLSW